MIERYFEGSKEYKDTVSICTGLYQKSLELLKGEDIKKKLSNVWFLNLPSYIKDSIYDESKGAVKDFFLKNVSYIYYTKGNDAEYIELAPTIGWTFKEGINSSILKDSEKINFGKYTDKDTCSYFENASEELSKIYKRPVEGVLLSEFQDIINGTIDNSSSKKYGDYRIGYRFFVEIREAKKGKICVMIGKKKIILKDE